MRNTMFVAFAGFLATLYGLVPVVSSAGLWDAVVVFLGLRGLQLHFFFPRALRAI
jgi:hypothetical protein